MLDVIFNIKQTLTHKSVPYQGLPLHEEYKMFYASSNDKHQHHSHQDDICQPKRVELSEGYL